MNRTIDLLLFRAKSIVCVMLVVQTGLWSSGCGPMASVGAVRIPLSDLHPLKGGLAGTVFAAASAVEVQPLAGRFRVVVPPGGAEISGSFVQNEGEIVVTQLTIGLSPQQLVSLRFNGDRQITSISTPAGGTWQRPASIEPPRAPAPPAAPSYRTSGSEVDAYVEANADLVALAEALDAPGGPKNSESSLVWLAAAALASIVLIPGGVVANLLFVFQVVTLVRLVLRV